MENNSHSAQYPAGAPRRGFIQTRLQNFGLTMIVMGASFILYYLGLFGGVEGPLTPARMGERLAATGFNNRHLLILMMSCTAVALSWNWMYNGICRLFGRRMVCTCRSANGEVCGAPARHKAGGVFVCSTGHQPATVRYQAVRKGTLAHFIWMMFAVFSGIVSALIR